MTPREVTIEEHTEIVKMLQSLEATNQNGELYMRATSGNQGSKGDPPTELLKNCNRCLGNMYLLHLFVGTRLKLKTIRSNKM
jgi:hypothetical protein